jgi:hypothetical protein
MTVKFYYDDLNKAQLDDLFIILKGISIDAVMNDLINIEMGLNFLHYAKIIIVTTE